MPQPLKKIHALNKAIGKINLKSPTALLAEVLVEQNFNKFTNFSQEHENVIKWETVPWLSL